MSCARTRTSVGPPRWTWRSTCSTACWTWDARAPSASLDPGRSRGQCGSTPDPCTTLTVQPFLDVRTAVLNGTLEDAFRQRYPGFRPANDDQALPEAA